MTAGNLTEAARLLHTSQPTVSRELARVLRKCWDTTLFDAREALTSDDCKGYAVRRGTTLTVWVGSHRQRGGKSAREFRQGELSICLPAGLFTILLPPLLPPFLALSGCQPEYYCRRVAVAGRVALRPAPTRADGDASCPGRNSPYTELLR